MTRLCSICSHGDAAAINSDILRHEQGYRVIARRYGVTLASLQRHAMTHLRATLAEAKETRAMMDAQALAERMRELESDVDWARAQAKRANDPRMLLLAVQQGRGNVELLAKLATQADVEDRLARLEAQQQTPDDGAE